MSWDGRIRGDARDIPLADKCVQCVVTSPPYWGLRDYSACGCVSLRVRTHKSTGIAGSQIASAGSPDCVRCGGSGHDPTLKSNQLGLERTPEEYVAAIVGVFREIWRVLKDDGVLWLNLGDSYIGSGMTGGTSSKEGSDKRTDRMFSGNRRDTVPGFKPKDLAGIPWMVAFALRSDGWYLRSDIIWAKPNPMPESVTDRPTKAHEYIFLLTKSESYFYDAAAIAEPFADDRQGNPGQYQKTSALERKAVNDRQDLGFLNNGGGWNADGSSKGRNKRTVWTIATQPYPEAHYATFPEEIPETCIRAGSKPGDLILDPFFGSGTVGRVAERLSRRWVGLDLGYQHLQEKRLRNVQRELTVTA